MAAAPHEGQRPTKKQCCRHGQKLQELGQLSHQLQSKGTVYLGEPSAKDRTVVRDLLTIQQGVQEQEAKTEQQIRNTEKLTPLLHQVEEHKEVIAALLAEEPGRFQDVSRLQERYKEELERVLIDVDEEKRNGELLARECDRIDELVRQIRENQQPGRATRAILRNTKQRCGHKEELLLPAVHQLLVQALATQQALAPTQGTLFTLRLSHQQVRLLKRCLLCNALSEYEGYVSKQYLLKHRGAVFLPCTACSRFDTALPRSLLHRGKALAFTLFLNILSYTTVVLNQYKLQALLDTHVSVFLRQLLDQGDNFPDPWGIGALEGVFPSQVPPAPEGCLICCQLYSACRVKVRSSCGQMQHGVCKACHLINEDKPCPFCKQQK